MAGKKKTTADGKTPLAKGRPGRKGKAAPTAALIPVAIEAPPAPAVPVSRVTETVPICDVCRESMTPPFSQCSLMRHIACGVCGVGCECRPCADMGVAAVYLQSPYLDTQFGGINVPCPYKKFGCGSSVACRDVREHQETCAWMPCFCPFCGVEISPAEFLRHLTDKTSVRSSVRNITYGTDVPFAINVNGSNFLLVAEEDGGLFLVVVGEAADGIRPVDVVCIRTVNTGRVYSSSVAVEGPLPKGLRHELKKKVIESLSDIDDELTVDSNNINISSASACDLLWVYPEMLHGEEEIHLCVRIDKV